MRDLRIDFLRGASLIIIFIDHFTATTTALRDEAFFFPTLNAFGLCSAAEFFVFFSGYVFGTVYVRRLETDGFWPCQLKAMARARHIFLVNFSILISVFGMTFLFTYLPQEYLSYSDLWLLHTDFRVAITKFTFFQYFPAYTDILPLYMIILAFSPLMLLLLRRRVLTAVTLSLALYVAAATIPALNLPLISHSKDQWTFNPLSWQLIFVMGMALGSKTIRIELNSTHKRIVLWLIGLALGAIALFRMASKFGRMFSIPYLDSLGHIDTLPGMDAQRVGPLRLLYFLSLLFFIMQMMPSTETLGRMRLARPMIACGEHSLEIFALTTLLCQLGGLIMFETKGHFASYIILVTVGTVLLLVAGVMLKRRVSGRLRVASQRTY